MLPELSLILTAYDEEEALPASLPPILKTLKKLAGEWELILVNNGSRDRTRAVMQAFADEYPQIHIVDVAVNRGYGYGVLQGWRASKGRFVAYAPADGQIDPAVLSPMIELLQQGKADFAIASRVQRHDNLTRKVISRFFNLLMRGLFGLCVKDLNGEPKMASREIWQKLNPISDGPFLDVELTLNAYRLGLRIHEVPMISPPRQGGRSKVRFTWCFHFLKNILIYRLTGKSADVCRVH